MGKASMGIGGILWAAAAVVLTSGCYSYAPVSLESVSPGQEIRARISAQGSDRIREQLQTESREIEGEVLSRENGQVLLNVTAALRQVGFRFEPLQQRVLLTEDELLELERKELDRRKTYFVAAGVGVAVGTALFVVLEGRAGGGTKQPPIGGPSDDRFVILSIPFR